MSCIFGDKWASLLTALPVFCFHAYSDAQREKFSQLYKISDSTDFEDTVIRLVDLVQNCLYIFGLFKLDDVDGLLCNATEGGLEEFYNTFLSNKFQVK